MTELLVDEIDSALGSIVLVAGAGRLLAMDYGDCRDRMMRLLTARAGAVRLARAPDPFGLSARVRAYLAGDLRAVDSIPVDTGGTPFQRRVWSALRDIPAGTLVTYTDLARAAGCPAAARAAGAANGRNPVAIVVPCHRVVATDASLTGYAGGLWRKRWLLHHEGALPLAAGPARRPGAAAAGALWPWPRGATTRAASSWRGTRRSAPV